MTIFLVITAFWGGIIAASELSERGYEEDQTSISVEQDEVKQTIAKK